MHPAAIRRAVKTHLGLSAAPAAAAQTISLPAHSTQPTIPLTLPEYRN